MGFFREWISSVVSCAGFFFGARVVEVSLG